MKTIYNNNNYINMLYTIIKKINLPEDIINIILEYSGYHKNRNGKYMKQLHNNLQIYKMLENKEKIINGRVELFIKYIKRNNYYEKMIILWHNYENNNYDNDFDFDFDFDFDSNNNTNNIINYECGLYEFCGHYNKYYQIESYYKNNKCYDIGYSLYQQLLPFITKIL